MMINGYQGLNCTNPFINDITSGGILGTPNLRHTPREEMVSHEVFDLGDVENNGCLVLELQDLQALKKGAMKWQRRINV